MAKRKIPVVKTHSTPTDRSGHVYAGTRVADAGVGRGARPSVPPSMNGGATRVGGP